MFDQIKWNLIEEEAATNSDFHDKLPQCVRSWRAFISQYESICDYAARLQNGYDPSFKDITFEDTWPILTEMLGGDAGPLNPIYVYLRGCPDLNLMLQRHNLKLFPLKQCGTFFVDMQRFQLSRLWISGEDDIKVPRHVCQIDALDFHDVGLAGMREFESMIPAHVTMNVTTNHSEVYEFVQSRVSDGTIRVGGSVVLQEPVPVSELRAMLWL